MDEEDVDVILGNIGYYVVKWYWKNKFVVVVFDEKVC